MEPGHLSWMLERMRLAYYAKDEVILSPEQGAAEYFFVIKQGLVHGEQKVANASEADTWLELTEGECFPLGALLANRAVASIYRAGQDTFCYELPNDDFHTLLGLSEPFRDFCTHRIANLLEHSKQIIQAQFAQSSTEQQSLNSPLSAVIRRLPVTCSSQTSIKDALQQMHDLRIGSMVAVDDNECPLGIFTLHDVLERIALPQIDLAGPVIDIMTTDLTSLPPYAPAYEAALYMAKHGFRHVLVVENKKLVGLVSEKDLFALQRVGLRQIGTSIRHAENVEALQQAAADIRSMAHNMMAQGVSAEQLTQFISTFNDSLTARVAELEMAASGIPDSLLAEGWCWMALGSEGRFEQTLNTDQDNALIFKVPEGVSADHMRKQLLPVAKRINAKLALCGFPLCKGQIMASNPKWCLSLDEWKRTFSNWVANGTPEELMHASIFFDFRPVHGMQTLAEELRSWLAKMTVENTRFLHMMAANALRNRPPLGIVRDFVLNSSNRIDLKLNGFAPFVDAARIFSLAAGVSYTGTIQRFRLSAPALHIAPAEVEAWINALLFIQMLRLRHHYETSMRKSGEAQPVMDNLIDPGLLNDLDRRILKEAFRQARKVQAKLTLDYQL